MVARNECLSVESVEQDCLPAIFELPASNGRFAGEQLKTLQKLGAARQLVLLAFPPKAAGTFLRTAIVRAIGGQLVRVVQAQGGRDATPYLPTFVDYFRGGVTPRTLVSHVHMLALPANLYFLQAFGIRPVVITRAIPDMLASYWDMLDNDDVAMFEGLNCHIPENFRQFSHNTKADFLVDVLGPWYVNFYAGWLKHAEVNPGGVCLIDYLELKRDPLGLLQRCLNALAIPATQAQCESALHQAWEVRDRLRFNKGEVGRGKAYFRPAHMHRLARMLSYYPVLEPYRGTLLGTPQ
jgi:hypothetical protein